MTVNDDLLERLSKIAHLTANDELRNSDREPDREPKAKETTRNAAREKVREFLIESSRETVEIRTERTVVTKAEQPSPPVFLKVENTRKKGTFWSTVHGLATEADRFFGLDGQKPSNPGKLKYKIELDSASLEAHMWLNM